MVDNLPLILTGLGLTASVLYYTMTLRNSNRTQEQALETRQAQLFMRLYETFSSLEFRRQWDEVMFQIEFSDWDDMTANYNREKNYEQLLSWFRVGMFFEGVGVLLKRGLIEIEMVDDLMGATIKMTWEKMGPIEIESRRRLTSPKAFDDFEYLYNKLMDYYEKHPELAP